MSSGPFSAPGKVSLWLGFRKHDPSVDLLRDLCGVDYYDVDFQECIVDDETYQVQPVRTLIERLSYSGSFGEDAIAAAESLRIVDALYAVAQYDFAYDPSAKAIGDQEPVFIGFFDYTAD